MVLLEFTSLGFVSKNIKEMGTLLLKLNINDHYVINKFTELPFVVHTWCTIKEIKLAKSKITFFWMNHQACDIIVEAEGLCK